MFKTDEANPYDSLSIVKFRRESLRHEGLNSFGIRPEIHKQTPFDHTRYLRNDNHLLL